MKIFPLRKKIVEMIVTKITIKYGNMLIILGRKRIWSAVLVDAYSAFVC